MVHFKDLFRRTKKRTPEHGQTWTCSTKSIADHIEHSITPATHINIAVIPAAGMQRSNQCTYITSYTSTTLSQDTSRSSTSNHSTTSDSSKTAVETNSSIGNGQSVWKGAPNGTTYDKREELTPEDEDMWANLSM